MKKGTTFFYNGHYNQIPNQKCISVVYVNTATSFPIVSAAKMTFLVRETLGKSLTKQYGRTDNNGNIAMIIPIYTEKLELRKRVL